MLKWENILSAMNTYTSIANLVRTTRF